MLLISIKQYITEAECILTEATSNKIDFSHCIVTALVESLNTLSLYWCDEIFFLSVRLHWCIVVPML